MGLSPPVPGESYYSQLLWCTARRPLGAAGFCSGPSPIIEKGQRTWHLDDGTICGSTTDLRATFEIIEAEGPLGGLF